MTPRGKILEEAKRLTEGDRNKTHGDPKPNMECFAQLLDAYLIGRDEYEIGSGLLDSIDGAIIMCLFKIARIAGNRKHTDSYIDLAAYAAIAGECAGVMDE